MSETTTLCYNIPHNYDSVAWHPRNSLILSGSRDNCVKLWNSRSGKEINSLTDHRNTVNFVSWNPINGNWFLSASRDKTVRLYDIRIIREKDPCMFVLNEHAAEVYAAAWHPLYESVLATGGYDGSMLFWILSGKDSRPYVQAHVPAAHEGAIWSMDWHPAGHLLCTGSNDRTCKFWSRMKPGSTEDDLYRGFLRDVSELDVLKAAGQEPPPIPDIDHGKEQEYQRQIEYRKRNTSKINLVRDVAKKRRINQEEVLREMMKTSIPAIGTIGENAKKQTGILLKKPAKDSPPQSETIISSIEQTRKSGTQSSTYPYCKEENRIWPTSYWLCPYV